ncbi:MAG: methyltransferase domain-containing protein [Blastocatellia bacterium]|nr:methyltransferase domain-containing protein [Blastocatellia bacterium]
MSRIRNFAHNLRILFSRKLSDYVGELGDRLNQRADNYERAVDARFDEQFAARSAELGERLGEIQRSVDERFDERVRIIDANLDHRFVQFELKADERFETVERRLDDRLEAHERCTDRYLLDSRTDIVDRTDVMLQIFEQRLDQQRRELRALREELARARAGVPENAPPSPTAEPPVDLKTLPEQPPAEQILSFRKLAENAGLPAKPRLQPADATLYQKILDWKKVSQEELQNFTPDEQEVVDYILSFIQDEGERHYTMQHMRRFIGTMQRLPPPQRSTDRLLELGSLLHIAPAIKKFCGYQEICGADVWDSEKKMTYETLMQRNGGKELHTFELHNFNAETDAFPFPDGHFRAVLCCELIEHLQSDPMHMLWECNRVLMEGGFLLLTTPNIASARSIEGLLVGCTPYLLSQYNRKTPVDQHNREYAPYEVGIALAAAGFTVVELETEDVWMRSNPAILDLLREVNLPTDKRGDNIFALARKTGAPVERHPKELYID